MKVIGNDFKEDIRIDRMKLEEECESHPSVYAYYGEEYAEARAKKDQEKDKLDLVLAERETVIRREAADSGMKTTEAVISALVTQDKEVQEQKEAYRNASAEVYTLDVAMGALDHKKSQLDNLVQLWTKNYYSNIKSAESESTEKRPKLNYRE